ncbi:MAG: D-alanyl-D-alanine carboxypeptidase [Micavibrio sp.]|nr:D-alanyl-D-alanine carboxypeptidase [Micavibrio sp.]
MTVLKRFLFIVILCFATNAFAADPFSDLTAKQMIVKDAETGQVLYERNPRQKMPTSSMSKVMTMYMVFDALEKGDIKLSDTFHVSEKAWAMGGSKMFVKVGDSVKVEDLIKGVIIQSGNDATIVLAEGLAGSEEAFAQAMNAKAEEIGLTHSHFVNASGWPDPDHYSSAADLELLAEHVIRDFPEFYKYFSIHSFEYNKINQRNRNPLLFRTDLNVDGLKTGHTEIGGYGLMASGTKNDRRVIMVMNGMESNVARAKETASVMSWALNGFDNETLLASNQVIADAKVLYGNRKIVPLSVAKDFVVTMPKLNKSATKIDVSYKEPIIAPIKAGDELGTLTVTFGDGQKAETPLVAMAPIKKSNVIVRFFAGLGYRLSGGV